MTMTLTIMTKVTTMITTSTTTTMPTMPTMTIERAIQIQIQIESYNSYNDYRETTIQIQIESD